MCIVWLLKILMCFYFLLLTLIWDITIFGCYVCVFAETLLDSLIFSMKYGMIQIKMDLWLQNQRPMLSDLNEYGVNYGLHTLKYVMIKDLCPRVAIE